MSESRLERTAERQSPLLGKVSATTFDRVIAPRLGAARAEVLVGPRHGIDAGIVDIGAGQVMAMTTDPFYVLPAFGWERAGWFAVQIVASDACTSGLAPAYAAIDLNLPLSISDGELEALWTAVDAACRDMGVSIVTGHTGRYDGCDYPMLGAMTVVAVGDRDRYVTPAMASPGDAVIVTKGAAIETAATFGALFPRRLAKAIGTTLAQEAENLFRHMSVVPDALTAVEAGVRDDGVTGLHDATERGVSGGLVEIAEACGHGMIVERDAILLPPAVAAVCDLFAIDPYAASSEGTLLLTCRPRKAAEILARLAAAGTPATQVGEITPLTEGIRIACGGRETPLHAPTDDPFWPALQRALDEWEVG